MNRIPIKVCGFVHPDDAAQACREDLDALGVVLDGGPDSVDAEGARAMVAATRGFGVELVAVAGSCTAAQVDGWLRFGFDRVQAVLTPEEADRLQRPEAVLPVLFDGPDLETRAQSLAERFSFLDAESRSSGLAGLLNVDGAGGGGTGSPADRTRAAQVARRFPLMLSGGLSAPSVAEVIQAVGPRAVDVNSYTRGPEGRKDFEKVRAFIAEVRRVERLRSDPPLGPRW